MSPKSNFISNSVVVVFLFGFGVAQPLFDILSRNAQFFVARDLGPLDICLLAVVLTVVLPSALVLSESLVRLANRAAGRIFHHLVVGLLLALFALPLIKKLTLVPWAAILAMSGIAGSLGSLAYARLELIRSRFALVLLSSAVIFFFGQFLFFSPVSRLVFESRPELKFATVPGEKVSAPVVMVVFDEFSSVFLMDENREVDAIRFPNLAALSRDATWYRNASTVSDYTHHAVPSILTGNYPEGYEGKPKLPTTEDYPDNLFTLLGSSYEMEVFETVTKLCPEELCGSEDEPSTFLGKTISLYSDLYTIYLHIILPVDLATDLPDITQTWQNFKSVSRPSAETLTGSDFLDHVLRQIKNERLQVFERFLASIDPSGPVALHFLHTLLPHVPFIYMPSGKMYSVSTDTGGLDPKTKTWLDERSAALAQQRYLLQVGFVDTLIGELVGQLQTAGLYDRSLIVITADHGVSFRSGDSRRRVTATNYPDIMLVPLFIKEPFQTEGVVSDLNIETVDILPTIADILGISLPWSVDGIAADDPRMLARSEKTFFARKSAEERLTFEGDLVSGPLDLDRNLRLFASGSMEKVFEIGPYKDLVGRPLGKFESISGGGCKIELDCPNCYDNIDPESPFVFTGVTGSVSECNGRGPTDVAIAINGVIRAVSRAFKAGHLLKFGAVIPEEVLRPGRNEVRLFSVRRADGNLVLVESQRRGTPTFGLSLGEGGEPDFLSSAAGEKIPVQRQGMLRGHLGSAAVVQHQVVLGGWAGDIEKEELVESIVIFENGNFVFSGRTNLERRNLAERYGEGLRWAGFRFTIPLALFTALDSSEVRVFGVSQDGVAVELSYFVGYPWGRKYSLTVEGETGTAVLLGQDGRPLPTIAGAFEGSLSEPRRYEKWFRVRGWAADLENREAPAAFAVFSNGIFLHADKPNLPRPGVVSRFDNEALLWSGFNFRVPFEMLGDPESPALRVFAISRRGFATEMHAEVPPPL